MDRATQFDEQRRHLFGVAYRMLGSAADAEDMVQEAFLRWRQAPDDVESPRAYLTTVVTRLCIDHLRSAKARREEYVGPWLPEPIPTSAVDGDGSVAIGDSLSMAFLVLLESLTPVERAAFLLREVFDYDYDEIAEVVGKSAVACRQLVSRARGHLAARRARFEAPRDRRDAIVGEFRAACATGNMQALLSLFAEEITVWSDGGGVVSAATRPVSGRDRVGRFLLGLLSKAPPGFEIRETELNGEPAFLTYLDGRLNTTLQLDVAGDRIEGIYIVRNPSKLTAVGGTSTRG